MKQKISNPPTVLTPIAGSDVNTEPTPSQDPVKPPMNYDEFIASQGLVSFIYIISHYCKTCV